MCHGLEFAKNFAILIKIIVTAKNFLVFEAYILDNHVRTAHRPESSVEDVRRIHPFAIFATHIFKVYLDGAVAAKTEDGGITTNINVLVIKAERKFIRANCRATWIKLHNEVFCR